MSRLSEKSPTLLVFTLGARHESRRRRLLPVTQTPVEDRLHQACLDAALFAGRKAGCRLEVSSPLELSLPADVRRQEQRGRDFGTRLERAFDRTLRDRGGAVILVGSDAPDLQTAHLERALGLLGQDPGRVVVGPSTDGGIYLLAAARPLGAALSRVRWRCRDTLRSLKRALRREGLSLVMLAPLQDLDRRADLERWLAASGRRMAEHSQIRLWRRLIVELSEILSGLRRLLSGDVRVEPRRRCARVVPLRGPPSTAACC